MRTTARPTSVQTAPYARTMLGDMTASVRTDMRGLFAWQVSKVHCVVATPPPLTVVEVYDVPNAKFPQFVFCRFARDPVAILIVI